ncbi:hypothetical protein [Sphingomonas hylomeconis]|uniref:Tail fiber assembly protein n=1 Tax=Sphingomonas hylomeconis TaxID=1395958 RepID=A0ABV7SU49_9SPHN|nr:hypothetical protein [Sphingomonas hylomeconis]
MIRTPLRYAASTNAFYDVRVHGEAIPTDAVPISAARHAELLAAQGARRIVAGASGKPAQTPAPRVTRADLLARAVAAVKREAARRILAIASLERQANDNAVMASLALQLVTGTEDGPDITADAVTAQGRRAAIDAVRVASNKIEAAIATWAMAALSKFDAGADPRWPLETAA